MARRALTVLGLGLAACAAPQVGRDLARDPPARPAGCTDVAIGQLQAAIDAAAPDAALCLVPGRHVGSVIVATRVTVWGPPDAVIATGGAGTTVRITAAGAALVGVTVDGTGGRFDRLDGAVLVSADDVTVRAVTIVGAVYGILVEKAKRVRILGNHIRGATDPSVGMRGDTLRLWETDDAEIADNLIEDGRDVVVWYSRRAHVHDNQVLRARYGTHFMYSHDGRVVANRYLGVTVGVFVMYTHGLELRGNVIANAAGAAGIAIGLKDAGATVIADNLLIQDEIGIYLDASPQRRDERVEITGNQVRMCRTAIVFHASSHSVVVSGNDFADNDLAVRVDGGGDALQVRWDGNYFDEYAGYDLDGDGIGDVPYELRSLAGELIDRHPELGFMRGTPAAALATAAAHLDPMYQPRLVLVDARPRMNQVATRVLAVAQAER
jgi:nitrous oxidase accessory protein